MSQEIKSSLNIANEVLSSKKLIAEIARATRTCNYRSHHVSIYYGEKTGLVITTQQNGWETRKAEFNIYDKMTQKQVIEHFQTYVKRFGNI